MSTTRYFSTSAFATTAAMIGATMLGACAPTFPDGTASFDTHAADVVQHYPMPIVVLDTESYRVEVYNSSDSLIKSYDIKKDVPIRYSFNPGPSYRAELKVLNEDGEASEPIDVHKFRLWPAAQMKAEIANTHSYDVGFGDGYIARSETGGTQIFDANTLEKLSTPLISRPYTYGIFPYGTFYLAASQSSLLLYEIDGRSREKASVSVGRALIGGAMDEDMAYGLSAASGIHAYKITQTPTDDAKEPIAYDFVATTTPTGIAAISTVMGTISAWEKYNNTEEWLAAELYWSRHFKYDKTTGYSFERMGYHILFGESLNDAKLKMRYFDDALFGHADSPLIHVAAGIEFGAAVKRTEADTEELCFYVTPSGTAAYTAQLWCEALPRHHEIAGLLSVGKNLIVRNNNGHLLVYAVNMDKKTFSPLFATGRQSTLAQRTAKDGEWVVGGELQLDPSPGAEWSVGTYLATQ